MQRPRAGALDYGTNMRAEGGAAGSTARRDRSGCGSQSRQSPVQIILARSASYQSPAMRTCASTFLLPIVYKSTPLGLFCSL